MMKYDLIVCGGGPAGAAAALAAASGGLRTALVERFGCLGGMASAGLVNPLLGLELNRGAVFSVLRFSARCCGRCGGTGLTAPG